MAGKSLRRFVCTDPIFGADVHVFVGKHIDVIRFFKRTSHPLYKAADAGKYAFTRNLEATAGRAARVRGTNGNRAYIVFIGPGKRMQRISTAYHEALHVTQWVLWHAGVDKHEDETRCYYQGWLAGEIISKGKL